MDKNLEKEIDLMVLDCFGSFKNHIAFMKRVRECMTASPRRVADEEFFTVVGCIYRNLEGVYAIKPWHGYTDIKGRTATLFMEVDENGIVSVSRWVKGDASATGEIFRVDSTEENELLTCVRVREQVESSGMDEDEALEVVKLMYTLFGNYIFRSSTLKDYMDGVLGRVHA